MLSANFHKIFFYYLTPTAQLFTHFGQYHTDVFAFISREKNCNLGVLLSTKPVSIHIVDTTTMLFDMYLYYLEVLSVDESFLVTFSDIQGSGESHEIRLIIAQTFVNP